MVLDIIDWRSVPFGKLLLTSSAFDVGHKTFKSPTNYIFSRLFSNSMMREEMVQAQADDLPTVYQRVSNIVFVQMLSKSIDEYVTQKCLENADFVQALLQTGDQHLVCQALPKNIYGKVLEQHRKRHQEQRQTEICDHSQDPIFYMYLAEKALQELLFENNLQEYLDQKFTRMSDLIRYLEKKFGRERIIRKAPDRQTLLHIHKQLQVDYTTSPSALIMLVRRKNIGRVRERNLAKLKTYLFNLMVDHVKPSHSARLEIRDAVVNREKQSISQAKSVELTMRMYLLWQQGALPSHFNKKVDAYTRSLYLPTDEEIRQYESAVFAIHASSDAQEANAPKNAESQYIVPSKSILHPNSADYLTMQGYKYPTCFHYIVVKFIEYEMNNSKRHVDKAVVLQKINKYETKHLIQHLQQWIERHRVKSLNSITDETMYIFFKDVQNQHLLLCTGDEPLNCRSMIPDLSRKMMKMRSTLSPKIYRLHSLNDVRNVYIVRDWCDRTRNVIAEIAATFTDWFKAKGSNRIMSVRDVIRHFYVGNEDVTTVNQLLDGALKNLASCKSDLCVVDRFLKTMYVMSNRWISPIDYEKLGHSQSDSMVMFALCKLLQVFDRLIDISVTIDEVDVSFAERILCNRRRGEDAEYLCEVEKDDDGAGGGDSDEEPVDYNDEDIEELEIEGNDIVYKHLLKYCYNNLSDCIENFLVAAVKNVDVTAHRSSVNFFAGSYLVT